MQHMTNMQLIRTVGVSLTDRTGRAHAPLTGNHIHGLGSSLPGKHHLPTSYYKSLRRHQRFCSIEYSQPLKKEAQFSSEIREPLPRGRHFYPHQNGPEEDVRAKEKTAK